MKQQAFNIGKYMVILVLSDSLNVFSSVFLSALLFATPQICYIVITVTICEHGDPSVCVCVCVCVCCCVCSDSKYL